MFFLSNELKKNFHKSNSPLSSSSSSSSDNKDDKDPVTCINESKSNEKPQEKNENENRAGKASSDKLARFKNVNSFIDISDKLPASRMSSLKRVYVEKKQPEIVITYVTPPSKSPAAEKQATNDHRIAVSLRTLDDSNNVGERRPLVKKTTTSSPSQNEQESAVAYLAELIDKLDPSKAVDKLLEPLNSLSERKCATQNLSQPKTDFITDTNNFNKSIKSDNQDLLSSDKSPFSLE
jgi:hypothetical protein